MGTSRWDITKSESKLKDLEKVVAGAKRLPLLILAHNNPDPDTIASALALDFILRKKFNVRSVIGYGGVVTRAENKAMIQRLRIDMKRLTNLNRSKYYGIALVDAQPGTGNNLLNARTEPPLIVIDHHPVRRFSLKSPFHDIRPGEGTTSTILTEYLLAADLAPTRSLANALLYGIKADTKSLVRGASDKDLKAFAFLSPRSNPRVMGWIENPALSVHHFVDYHRGLARTHIHRDVATSFLGKIQSEAIIPQLADDLLRLDGVSISFCLGLLSDMIMLSLRSSSRTYGAGKVIRKLVGKSGFAGGHRDMAGGQVPVQGKSGAEIRDIAHGLIQRLLKLVDRDHCHAKRLVARPPEEG
jgi:nanoRNase/pAp phosphatase (c-di-AMP/oligoRNAs hydrolase)